MAVQGDFWPLAAAVQVGIQKGGAVVWLFGSVVWLFSGTMFPINVLPAPLQAFAKLMPLTYALEGLRGALLKGTSLTEMVPVVLSVGALAAEGLEVLWRLRCLGCRLTPIRGGAGG